MDELKEVWFDEFCKTCKYEQYPEELNPCCECLEHPARENSHKPEKWKRKKENHGKKTF